MISCEDKKLLVAKIEKLCIEHNMEVVERSECYSSDRSNGLMIYDFLIQVADFDWKNGLKKEHFEFNKQTK